MRNAFLTTIMELAAKDKNLMVITADLGFSVFEGFAENFPDQYLNVGVAEQNMVGVAAGLALEGKKVFLYSIANFPTFRCLEQIRNDICYHNLNINIVASGAGFSYGGLGMTHHATEDIGILRPLPNISILVPGTKGETETATKLLYTSKGAGYLRIDKTLYEGNHLENIPKIGNPVLYKKGRSVALIALGGIVAESMKVAELLTANKIDCSVMNIFSVKPIDDVPLIEIIKEADIVVTMEEHNLVGGLSTVLSEILVKNNLHGKKLLSFGLQDTFSSVVGSQSFLRKYYGLDAENVSNQILKELKKFD